MKKYWDAMFIMVPINCTAKLRKGDIISKQNKGDYMSKKAKQYSATEKSKIVIEAIKGELTIAQITSKYGVHSTQIQEWKKKGLEYLQSGFQNKVKSKHLDNEELIKQLYEQIGQLNMECNWLKKKSTLFGV